MVQDLFGAFDRDLQRLLLAGSSTLAGDEGLARAQEAFGKLAVKVPALAAMQEQIGKVLSAQGRTAATELLHLGVMLLKIRGAQGKPVVGEGFEPLPTAAPLETSIPQRDLEVLYRALTSGVTLTGKKMQRRKIVEDAIARGTFRDLRLLDLWVNALADPTLGELVAEKILPALGEAAADRIEQQFNPKGKSTDARRLRCLVAIRGEAMKPLVESCLQAGDPHISPPLDKTLAYGKKDRRKAEPNASVEVRTAAVEALEKVAPAEAEARACALYRAETQQEIRVACVQVMGIGEQDTTLEMLLEALKDTDDVSRAAVQSLQRFRHPKTTERVLALLTREVLDLKPYRPPRAKASRQISQAQQGQQKAEKKVLAIIAERSAWIRRAIQVLGRRPSPEVLDKLIDLYTHHPISVIRETAGEALKASGERRAMEVLIQHLDREGDATEALAVWAFFHLDLNTVFERMQPFLTEQALSTKKGLAIAAKLLAEISGDGQFLDMVEDDREESKKDDTIDADVIPELEGDGTILEEEVRMAAPYLARKLARYPFCQDPRWADVALRLLPRKELTGFCIGILGNLRDPRGRDPLLALLRRNIHPYDAAQGLFRIGDRSIVPNLIELLSLKGPRSAVIQLLGSFKAQEAVEPLCALLTEEIEGTNQIFEALRCIGDPRAASAIAAALCHKNIRTYPYQALRALRQLDNPAAIPSLQEAMKMLKRSKHSWLVSQYEELIHYLERDRKV